MARICHRRVAVRIDAGDQAGDEAAVSAPQQPAVQAAQNGRRALCVFGQGTQRAHNQRNRHRRFESLAAYVTQSNQRTAIVRGDDLEEIAAHLFRGAVYAGNRQTGDRRRLFGNENLLHFAGRLYFKFDAGLPLPLQKLLARNGENQGQEQYCAEEKSHVEEVTAGTETETLQARPESPMCKSRALNHQTEDAVKKAVRTGSHDQGPSRRLSPRTGSSLYH